MLFKLLFTTLAILWLLRVLAPWLDRLSKPAKDRRQMPGNDVSIRSADEDLPGEYIDYEEIKK